VIGTAGLSDFCGSDPVMATVMMHGVVMRCSLAPRGSPTFVARLLARFLALGYVPNG
jgi:hypothetical protein